MKKAERRNRTAAVVRKRARLARRLGVAVCNGKLRKKAPMDCGKARCVVCHREKLEGKRTVAERRTGA